MGVRLMAYLTTEQAVRLAADATEATDPAQLVGALKALARERADLVKALTAHRGVIVAIAEDDGEEMVERLENAWPTS